MKIGRIIECAGLKQNLNTITNFPTFASEMVDFTFTGKTLIWESGVKPELCPQL